ncbi:MAG: PA domain-containing protein, partial [Bacteroidota bacterium]
IVLTTTPNNEACEAFSDDLSGKIAMIDRGTCQFSTKVLNAQNQGALAVIICNNVDGGIRMLGGDVADQVRIPSVSMTMQDCDILKADLQSVTAKLEYVEDQVAVETFWGANGEGSFNDGTLGGWTATSLTSDGNENWTVHRAAVRNNTAGDLSRFDVPLSYSYHQGFVAYEAELYQGDNPGGAPYPFKGGDLTSPIIDCSNCTNTGIEAFQYYGGLNRGFNSRDEIFMRGASVAYSIDGGTSWEDTIIVNTEFAANEESPAAHKLKVFIPELDGQPNVRIKFLFEMDFYIWALDDIKVIRLEDNNLALINDFYALPPALSMPASQITPFQFVTDIRNLGALAQPNT